MARRKIADVARPEPVEYEDDEGRILFTMPRRFWHLSTNEKHAYEAANFAARDAAEKINTLAAAYKTEDATEERNAEYKAESNLVMAETRDKAFEMILIAIPDMTREVYASFSELKIRGFIEDFMKTDFPMPTVGPATLATDEK